MKSYDELKALIEQRGVHAEFGDAGEGWAIEQNPHELATFLVRMQELGVQSVLEIGTGYKGGLSRFLAHDMGWQVTSYDIVDYGHQQMYGGWKLKYKTISTDREYNKTYNTPIPRMDLVFIDGDHSHSSVMADYHDWLKSARYAIAFHDISGLRNCEGVKEFWDYIMCYSTHITIFEEIAPAKQSGIGWIEL